MGLTNWRGVKPSKQDVAIAKNYLNEEELSVLNNLVEQYLIFAEGQAMRRVPMHMQEWIGKLDGFLTFNDRDILDHVGKVSHEIALKHAHGEYETFKSNRLRNEAKLADDRDFETLAKQLSVTKKDQNK